VALPRLRALRLRVEKPPGLLRWLERLPALQTLDLGWAELDERESAALLGGPLAARLVELRLADTSCYAGTIDAVLAMPRLERLGLDGRYLGDQGFATILASPLAARLRGLYIVLRHDLRRRLWAARLPELRELATGGLDDAAAVALAGARGMPRLQRLIGSHRMSPAGEAALRASPHLPLLHEVGW
jgi:hypothetical protein